MTNNIIVDLSMDFSVAIVNLSDSIKEKSAIASVGIISHFTQNLPVQKPILIIGKDGFRGIRLLLLLISPRRCNSA